MINVAEINWAKPSNHNASQLIHLNNQEAIESLIYLSEFIEVDVKLLNTLSIGRFKNKLYKHMPQLYITHEAAHNLLYHIWFRERILIDDNGLFYTPFRLDYRPISGVFHAMFVLARTIYTFNYLLQAEISNLSYEDISSHYNEANNTLKFKEKFRQTVNVLNSSKKLTVFGEKIINDCIELVHKCHIGI